MDASLPYSHFKGTESELIRLVKKNFGRAQPGYRHGVLLVPVDPAGFYSPVCELSEGDELVGAFTRRREGETPRITIGVKGGKKTPAVACSIVLYSRKALEESGSPATGADYDCIMIQARTSHGEEPMHPDVLMHNHFGSDGGTDTKMSPEEFETKMREGFQYWKSRAMVGEVLIDKNKSSHLSISLSDMLREIERRLDFPVVDEADHWENCALEKCAKALRGLGVVTE